MSKIKNLHRRTFLRGMGSMGLALPFLEIMMDAKNYAWAQAAATPKRIVVFFCGQALGGDDDTTKDLYVPNTIGRNYDLKVALEPLGGSAFFKASANYSKSNYNNAAVKDDVTVVSGLKIPYSGTDSPAAAGWANDFHIQAFRPLLTGMRTGTLGPSVDQKVAAAIGTGLRFKTLNFSCQPSFYLQGFSAGGRDLLSYDLKGNGVVAQTSPQNAYKSIFTGFTPSGSTANAAAQAELNKRKSILDLVSQDFTKLMNQLGAQDKLRLTQHADEIRDLERRLASLPPPTTSSCKILTDPGADPSQGGDAVDAASGLTNVNVGYSNEGLRAQIFCDLMHMAFACDMTRAATLMITQTQSHMNVFPLIGVGTDQHELGHSGGGSTRTKSMSRMIAWHVDHFAYFINKLKSTPEGSGTMLDNTVVIFLNEAGHGYDPGAGKTWSTHSTENMACLIAGKAGGLKPGKHVVAAGKHPVNVLISGMNAVGVAGDMGEVKGNIPELFTD